MNDSYFLRIILWSLIHQDYDIIIQMKYYKNILKQLIVVIIT